MSLEICKMIMENPGNAGNRSGNRSCQNNSNNIDNTTRPLANQGLLIPALMKDKVKPVVPPKPKNIPSAVTLRPKSTIGTNFNSVALPPKRIPRNIISCPAFDENGAPTLKTPANELNIHIVEHPKNPNEPSSSVEQVVKCLESRSPKPQLKEIKESKESTEDISRKWIAQNLVSGSRDEIIKSWIPPPALNSGRVGEISKTFNAVEAIPPVLEQPALPNLEVTASRFLKPAIQKPEYKEVKYVPSVQNIVLITETEVIKPPESKQETVASKVLSFSGSDRDKTTAPISAITKSPKFHRGSERRSPQSTKSERVQPEQLISQSTQSASGTTTLKSAISVERSNSNPTRRSKTTLPVDSTFIRQSSLPGRGGCWRKQVLIAGAHLPTSTINPKARRESSVLAVKALLESQSSSSRESLSSAPPVLVSIPKGNTSPALSPSLASDSDGSATPVRPPRRSKRKSLLGDNGEKLSDSSESGEQDEVVKESYEKVISPIYRKRGQGLGSKPNNNIRKSSRLHQKEKYNDNKEKTSLLVDLSDNKCDEDANDDKLLDRPVSFTKSAMMMAKAEKATSSVLSAASQLESLESHKPQMSQSSNLEPVSTSSSVNPSPKSGTEHALNQILEVDEDAELPVSTISGSTANSTESNQGDHQLVPSSSISSDDFQDALETQNTLQENHSFLFTACPSGCGNEPASVDHVLTPELTITTSTSTEFQPAKPTVPSINSNLTDENENAVKVNEQFEQLRIDITQASSTEASLTGSNDTLNDSISDKPNQNDSFQNSAASQSLLLEIQQVLGGSEVTLNIPDEDTSPTSSPSPTSQSLQNLANDVSQIPESEPSTPIVALRIPKKRCLAPTLSLSKEGGTSNGRSSIFNLRRKSSVPNLFSSHSPIDNASQNNNNDEYEESSKLRNRRSWTNQSISSIGSTTSSSSLGSSIRNKATLSLPRQRKLSDVASWFWPDDSSNGNYGDNESSPNHSSAENIHPTQQDHHIRPSIRRKKTSSIFSKAMNIRKVSSIFKGSEGSHRKTRSEVPKLEITIVRNHGSDTEQHSPNLPKDSTDSDYSPASAFEPTDFNEKCEQIIQAIPCPKQKKSFYVAREILSSEKTFVNVLHLITTSFPSSIEATAKRLRLPNKASIISDKDLDDIQGGLPTLRVMNEFILKDLYDRIYNWKENAKIADIFVTKGPFLKHYTHYIKDFEKHIKIFDNLCEKQPHFAAAVREFESSKKCQFLGLKSYMLKPVQRMPQYALLLEDYLKTLDEEHPDLEDTKKAIQIVKSVAEHANEAIRTQITIERLMQLQARLQDYVIVGDNRMIVKEGELQKASRKENQPRYFVLMSDVLLVMNYANAASSTAHKDSPLKLKYNLPLNRMKVMLPSFDETSCEFSIISRAISFSVFAKSKRDRDEWVEALQRTIQEFMESHPSIEPEFDTNDTSERLGKQAPVMVQDSRVSMCQSCHYEFKLAFRRHHCRSCGQVVCRNCSSNEAPLEYLEFDTARVCDTCYDLLLNDFEQEHPKDGIIFIRNRLKFRKTNAINMTSLTRVSKVNKTIRLPTKSELAQEAVDTEVKIRGYLKWREKKVWNRNWVVLIGRVLYFFIEPEDTVAVKTIAVLGYNFEVGYFQEQNQELRCFKLGHVNREDICFQVENQAMVKKWEIALSEAVTMPI